MKTKHSVTLPDERVHVIEHASTEPLFFVIGISSARRLATAERRKAAEHLRYAERYETAGQTYDAEFMRRIAARSEKQAVALEAHGNPCCDVLSKHTTEALALEKVARVSTYDRAIILRSITSLA